MRVASKAGSRIATPLIITGVVGALKAAGIAHCPWHDEAEEFHWGPLAA